jgi:4-amino-4-deoxy-L-arabinose transferase-like glycosyltransferase
MLGVDQVTASAVAQNSPAGDQPAARRRADLAIVLALMALATLLRFYRLGNQGFWFDEANTALLVHFSPGKMIGLIPQTESTPPLYYMAAWVWARVFGYGEAGLRSLSALAGVLVVPLAYLTGAKLVGRRAGVIVAALTACSPLLVWYSQEARSYELLVALGALALLAFAYVRADPSPALLAAWAAVSALSLATHYYAVIAVAPQAAWLLVERPRSRVVRIAVAAVTVCGLALLPLALSQIATGNESWIVNSPLAPRLEQIIPQFLIGTGAPARKPLKLAAMALALIALVLLVRADRTERRGATVAAFLAVGGFLLSLLFVGVGSDALITRNIILLWLPAALLLSAGLAAARPRLLGVGLTAALCAIGLTAVIGVAFDYDLQRPDWRSVARVLGTAPPPAAAAGSAVAGRAILIQHYRTLLPLSLYLPGLELWPGGGKRVSELDVISISSPPQPLCWWGAACNLMPSQMQASYRIPGFHELWLHHAHRFTVMRLVSSNPVSLTSEAVSRALWTTHLVHDELLLQR